MHNHSILLHLSLIEGIGPGVVQKILESLPKNKQLDDLYDMYTSDLITLLGLPEKTASALYAGLRDKTLLEQELALIHRHGISLVTCMDEEYPQLLKAITIPPTVLYYRGKLPSNDTGSLAVVGARQANYYGFGAVEALVPELVKKGIAIISGGALGIDRAAHEQAIAAGGRTVAVLGSGLLSLYPLGNKKMFESIVANGGALVSSFPLRMGALPGHFPARNRIISGLSSGCLVVQAAKKSGALITARYALEQGREVFAVPGPIDSFLSVGCHALIREGATLVTCAQDIEQSYTLACSPKPELAQISLPQDTPEERVKQLCATPQSIESLADKTGFSLAQIHEQLFELQLEGVVAQDFMGLWHRS